MQTARVQDPSSPPTEQTPRGPSNRLLCLRNAVADLEFKPQLALENAFEVLQEHGFDRINSFDYAIGIDRFPSIIPQEHREEVALAFEYVAWGKWRLQNPLPEKFVSFLERAQALAPDNQRVMERFAVAAYSLDPENIHRRDKTGANQDRILTLYLERGREVLYRCLEQEFKISSEVLWGNVSVYDYPRTDDEVQKLPDAYALLGCFAELALRQATLKTQSREQGFQLSDIAYAARATQLEIISVMPDFKDSIGGLLSAVQYIPIPNIPCYRDLLAQVGRIYDFRGGTLNERESKLRALEFQEAGKSLEDPQQLKKILDSFVEAKDHNTAS